MNDHKASHAAEKLGARGVGLFDEAKERISDLTDSMSARGEKLMEQAKDRGNEILGDAQDQGKNAWNSVEKYIQKHPGKAVGYGIVAGAVLYALLGRREDKS